jgi:microcystin degradation protein MlrC
MQPHVLIAGLFHETHTFLDFPSRLDQFSVSRGEELLRRRGDGSPLAGVLEAAERFAWRVIPALDVRAQPSGTVDQEVFDIFWSELEQAIRRAVADRLDAIYLVLHGAMVTTELLDVEGELLARLRRLPGCELLPVFGVFDLHATFTEPMARHSNCLIAYRENPHADAHAMAVLAAEKLHACLMSRTCPRTFWQHSGIAWPPTGTGTADSPMRDLEALARRLEAEHPEFVAVNVVGGFAFADTPDMGASFTVSTVGDEATAQPALNQLCELAWKLRELGDKRDPPLKEVLDEVASGLPGLTVIAEPSDNIGGGAPGDGTGLLRGLVEHRIANAAVCLCDPGAVAALQMLSPGERMSLPLGGRGSRLDPGPFMLEVEIVSRQPGRFALEDRHSHLASLCGDTFDMGACAVVRHGGVTILLTSIKTPPFDLGQWRSQGIEPASLSAIGVKAAVAHTRAYEPIAARMRWADTPGPCRSDLRQLPYRHVRRGIWPVTSG